MNQQTGKRKIISGTLIIGIIVGILFWGGFNTALRVTNTEAFCISCHEMAVNVYQEYTDTIHYTNRTGVRATCSDCHVPKEWEHKVVRKIYASNELYHHFMGTIDTPEKFEAKRFELAKSVWRTMKKTDSRECRNCHAYESMDLNKQEGRAIDQHEIMEESRMAKIGVHDAKHALARNEGLTCIDCHKGIAHRLPTEYDPEKDIPGNSPYYDR